MVPGGRPLADAGAHRADYPSSMHGVSMSLASTDPLDLDYLKELKALADRVEPAWVSDHLAWTGVHGRNLHDLLPIPYTSEALDHVVDRIGRAQDVLKRRLVIENASTYVAFTGSEMPEWEFVARMAERADCLLLLDVNNVFVSGFNHGFDVEAFIDAVPRERVAQFHMAGHTDNGTHCIDTHDQPIRDEVWTLYGKARRRFGDVARWSSATIIFRPSTNCSPNFSACVTSTPPSPPPRRGARRETERPAGRVSGGDPRRRRGGRRAARHRRAAARGGPGDDAGRLRKRLPPAACRVFRRGLSGAARPAWRRYFEALVEAFIDANPSRSRNARWYSTQLPDFMQESEAWGSNARAIGLACFERALTDAYDAADAPAKNIETLAEFSPEDWPRLAFAFHPSLRLLDVAAGVCAPMPPRPRTRRRRRPSTGTTRRWSLRCGRPNARRSPLAARTRP